MPHALHRATLALHTPLGTPLAGDTLFGQICWALREAAGEAELRRRLEGYTEGSPWLVVSDGFPAGYLPRPTLPAAGEKMHGGPALATIVRTLNPGKVVAVDLRYADPALNGGIKTATQGEKEGYGWTSDVRRLRDAERVYFCESAVNALSIETASIPMKEAADAIRGVANAGNIDLTWCRGKQVIIVPDNDEPGADGYCVGMKAAWRLHGAVAGIGHGGADGGRVWLGGRLGRERCAEGGGVGDAAAQAEEAGAVVDTRAAARRQANNVELF